MQVCWTDLRKGRRNWTQYLQYLQYLQWPAHLSSQPVFLVPEILVNAKIRPSLLRKSKQNRSSRAADKSGTIALKWKTPTFRQLRLAVNMAAIEGAARFRGVLRPEMDAKTVMQHAASIATDAGLLAFLRYRTEALRLRGACRSAVAGEQSVFWSQEARAAAKRNADWAANSPGMLHHIYTYQAAIACFVPYISS